MLIDSHCHVLDSEYENAEEVLLTSFKNGVDKIIINGYDLESSKNACFLAEKYKNAYATVGIGPQNIDDIDEQTFKQLEALIKNKKVVAIGEIGLDYYWTKENKHIQINVFRKMLEMAQKYKLPVIVHCRDSFLDTYNLLEEYKVRGIIHCYSGSLEMAKRFIKLGFLLGIGGVVTFKNAKELKKVVENIDIKYFSLETDSPYLTPEPLRGKKNIPENVIIVAKKLAEIKKMTFDEVVKKTGKEVARKFDL